MEKSNENSSNSQPEPQKTEQTAPEQSPNTEVAQKPVNNSPSKKMALESLQTQFLASLANI